MQKSRFITGITLFSLIITATILSGCEPSEAMGARSQERLNEWQFCQDTSKESSELVIPESDKWEELSLPHVFRLSGLYEKSAGWYKKTITAANSEKGKRFWLFFEGAGSVVDVFVNGEHIGQHKGAFTASAFDITKAVKFGGENGLMIRVTNRDLEAANCLSQSNLFYTNGGLYRPVWLIKTSDVQIYPYMGSTGVFLTPKNITDATAELEIETYIQNNRDEEVEYKLCHTIVGTDGKECGELEIEGEISANTTGSVQGVYKINNLQKWNILDSHLYTVKTKLEVGEKVCDYLEERTGVRTVAMHDGCFMINGKELLARGVCKHHQGENQWNAMTDEDLRWEMDGMVDLGCNAVRLAHYPHRRFEYSMADEYGLAIWAENGLAGQKWDPENIKRETKPTADGERITREMVLQNWNHPSIVFWSSGNETYQEVASHYADIIRATDTTRLITYASAGEKPSNVDFVAGNTYQGWYYDRYTNFKQVPKNSYVSETGSGSWITQHVPYGTMKWKVDHYEPEEYSEMVSEFRFQTIFKNNPSAHKMFLWWNYREFYNKKFKGNRNTKGILTLAGMPKDFYYHFQAFLKPNDPVLHLCGRHFFYRQFAADNGIKVYSNADQAELFINGKSCGVKKNGEYVHPDYEENGKTVKGPMINNVFFWKDELAPGKNVIEVKDDRGLSESMVIYQKPAEGPMPVGGDSMVTELASSNANCPAVFIDREVEEQGPFYTEVDGSSDNTFGALPNEVHGAKWIATKRLSDEKNVTDISFKVTKDSTVYVLYANGKFPLHTLEKSDTEMMKTSEMLKAKLTEAGFADTGYQGTWRRHGLWLGYFGMMKKSVKAGEMVSVKGEKLDYVILVKP